MLRFLKLGALIFKVFEAEKSDFQGNCERLALPAEATCRPEARGCRATAGGLEGSSGELLEAIWGFKNLSWRALGDVLEAH